MRVLSKEEHDNFKHICGFTGKEIEELAVRNKSPCYACDKETFISCLASHAIVGADAEQRLAMEKLGVDLTPMFVEVWGAIVAK